MQVEGTFKTAIFFAHADEILEDRKRSTKWLDQRNAAQQQADERLERIGRLEAERHLLRIVAFACMLWAAIVTWQSIGTNHRAQPSTLNQGITHEQ